MFRNFQAFPAKVNDLDCWIEKREDGMYYFVPEIIEGDMTLESLLAKPHTNRNKREFKRLLIKTGCSLQKFSELFPNDKIITTEPI